MDAAKRRVGYLEGTLSALLNTVLFALKIWVGTTTGSVAVVADAWHTLSDTLTSLVVVFGFWISSRPRDAEHPFGHGRAELVASVIVGVLLGMVGIGFLRDSIQHLTARARASFNVAALVVFSVSVVTKEAIAQFSIRAGRRMQSSSLVADGWHHRSDAIASGLVLIGVALGRYLWWLDAAFGIGVSLLILYVAFDVIRGATNAIQGEKPSDELLREVSAVIQRVTPDLRDVHHVHLHRYGDHIELTLHARLPGNAVLDQAHTVAEQAEAALRAELGIEPTIHVEPRRCG